MRSGLPIAEKNNDRRSSNEAIDRLVYVQAMLLDLKAICDAEQCTFLAHLLEMAYIEACDGLRRVGTQSSNRTKN